MREPVRGRKDHKAIQERERESQGHREKSQRRRGGKGWKSYSIGLESESEREMEAIDGGGAHVLPRCEVARDGGDRWKRKRRRGVLMCVRARGPGGCRWRRKQRRGEASERRQSSRKPSRHRLDRRRLAIARSRCGPERPQLVAPARAPQV